MATASVPNVFVNGQDNDGPEVNANFTSLVSFLNNSVVHRDGSKAMSSAFDAGTFKVIRVGAGVAGTDAVNKSQLDAVAADVAAIQQAPVGASMEWYTDTAPSGWLLQDGSAVSRATYADLFAVIGTTFGVGDGSTTFNLPDRRDRFPIGKGVNTGNDAVGETGGSRNAVVVEHTHAIDPPSLTVSGGSHSHQFPVRTDPNASGSSGFPMISNSTGNTETQNTYATDGTDTVHSHTVNIPLFASNSTGGSSVDKNLPPYFTVNYIIFTGV